MYARLFECLGFGLSLTRVALSCTFPEQLRVICEDSVPPCGRHSGSSGTSWVEEGGHTLWHDGPDHHSYNSCWKRQCESAII